MVTLPSGVTSAKMVKAEFMEDLESLKLSVQMPVFLTNAFLLHKHTFPDNGTSLLGTEPEVVSNLRITCYNKLLNSIGYKRGGSQLWYQSTIALPEAASSKQMKKKFLKCNTTGCLVLFIDYIIEASDFEEVDEEFDVL